MRRFLARGLLALALGLLLFGVWVLWGLPARSEVRVLAKNAPESTALMRQREAEGSARGRKIGRAQRWVPLSQMSRHLIHATLASEDQNFFGHDGVDWKAIQES